VSLIYKISENSEAIENNTDLRYIRTQKKIKKAFFELMDTIGLEEITVKNLTKKAAINRTTFYLHYNDKYDLLDQIENDILEGLKSIVTSIPYDVFITKVIAGESPFSLVLRYLEYIHDNRQFFSLIMGKKGNPGFIHKLYETIKVVMVQNNVINRLKIPDHYAFALFIGLQTSLINEWLSSGMRETPYELASLMSEIIHGLQKNIYK
jgi:AcrR family transcriptional regulator